MSKIKLKKRATKKAMKYNYVDKHGMRWRMVGSRPVSQLADFVMKECGFKTRSNGIK